MFARKRGKPGLVGIYAAPDKLSVARVVHESGRPVLVSCESFDAASDKDKEDALERYAHKYELDRTRANFVLSPNDYKLLLIEAPRVEPGEVAAAVKWKIKDLVDSPVEELVVTVFPVPDDAYRGQNDMVYAVAARRSRIRQVVDLVNRSGLELEAIDIPELVLMNISRTFSNDSDGLAFIDLRSSGSTLNLSKDGQIYLTRHLNTRVDQDIVYSEDWELIRERLVLEIQRSLDYYESQMGQAPIPRVLLAPRAGDFDLLARQLNESMAVQVEGLNLAEKFNSSEELPLELQQSCILAIGGAMRNGQAIA